jgi:hypothetical protein
MDGQVQKDKTVPLVDDLQEHKIKVTISTS